MNYKIFIAGVVAGVLSNVSGYVITGRWFHRFQSQTPNTWRASESWVHYQYAALIRLLVCIGVAYAFAALTNQAIPVSSSAAYRGVLFGGFLWLVTALPIIVETSLFVNWHKGFVVGLLLDWFVLMLLAGIAGAIAVSAI